MQHPNSKISQSSLRELPAPSRRRRARCARWRAGAPTVYAPCPWLRLLCWPGRMCRRMRRLRALAGLIGSRRGHAGRSKEGVANGREERAALVRTDEACEGGEEGLWCGRHCGCGCGCVLRRLTKTRRFSYVSDVVNDFDDLKLR